MNYNRNIGSFLKDLACRGRKVSGEVKSFPYLLQRLAVAVQGKKSVESFRNHCVHVIVQRITRKSIKASDFCVILCSITRNDFFTTLFFPVTYVQRGNAVSLLAKIALF